MWRKVLIIAFFHRAARNTLLVGNVKRKRLQKLDLKYLWRRFAFDVWFSRELFPYLKFQFNKNVSSSLSIIQNKHKACWCCFCRLCTFFQPISQYTMPQNFNRCKQKNVLNTILRMSNQRLIYFKKHGRQLTSGSTKNWRISKLPSACKESKNMFYYCIK